MTHPPCPIMENKELLTRSVCWGRPKPREVTFKKSLEAILKNGTCGGTQVALRLLRGAFQTIGDAERFWVYFMLLNFLSSENGYFCNIRQPNCAAGGGGETKFKRGLKYKPKFITRVNRHKSQCVKLLCVVCKAQSASVFTHWTHCPRQPVPGTSLLQRKHRTHPCTTVPPLRRG